MIRNFGCKNIETYLCEPCNISFIREEQFTGHGKIIHNEQHENVEFQEVTDLTVHEKENPHLFNFTTSKAMCQ